MWSVEFGRGRLSLRPGVLLSGGLDGWRFISDLSIYGGWDATVLWLCRNVGRKVLLYWDDIDS